MILQMQYYNKLETHIWKPLLHEVATGTLNVGEDELNYFTHAYQHGYRFHYGYMNGLDHKKKIAFIEEIKDLEGKVVMGPREFKYDTLVLAVGGQTNDFGVPGVKEHCLTLNSTAEAEKIRKKFLGNALNVIFKNIPTVRIGIVGGGATGIELAAYVHHALTEIKSYGARISSKQVEISILEASPRLLPGTPEHMGKFSEKVFTGRGIEVIKNCAIKSISDKGFHLQDGTVIEKEIRIWTAGIKAPDWLAKAGLQVDRANKVIVNEWLQSVDDPSIYAIGDCAHVKDYKDKERILPASAQCAHQEAEWLAKKIRNDVLNKKTRKPFVFVSQGMLVSLGDQTAVGSVSGIFTNFDYKMKGRIAKFLYSTLYRLHQAAVYGNMRAFFIFIGDKFRGLTTPNVKLH